MLKEINKFCNKHGNTIFVLRTDKYYRCRKCAADAVILRRKRIKEKAVKLKGGCCSVCGYSKSIAALEFHHIDPTKKDFQIMSGKVLGWEKIKRELDKCLLLCANCHREEHERLRLISDR